MAKYLKKKKMYELLKEKTVGNIPKLKDFEYKFYRGSEWIETSIFIEKLGELEIRLCNQHGELYISFKSWDMDCKPRKNVWRLFKKVLFIDLRKAEIFVEKD